MAARFYVETWAARRTPSIPTRSSPRCWPTGSVPADAPGDADLVVVNTCAFVEAARQESIDVALGARRREAARRPARGHRLHGRALRRRARRRAPRGRRGGGLRRRGLRSSTSCSAAGSPPGVRDLLELPRPAPRAPWAYVKVAEGCDRACAFCAIPSFRGQAAVADDRVDRGRGARRSCEAGVAEIVLVAQDLAWYGRDVGEPGSLAPLLRRLDRLGAHGLATGPPPLSVPERGPGPAASPRCSSSRRSSRTSTCRCSTPHRDCCGGMKRWGSGDRFLEIIESHPRLRTGRRVPVVVHRRVPRRDRGRPRRAARLPARAPHSTGPGSSRSRPRTAPRRRTLDGDRRRGARGRAAARVRRAPGADHAGRARRARRRDASRCSSTAVDEHGALVGRTHREAPEIDGVVRIAGAAGPPGARASPQRRDRRRGPRPGRGAACSPSVVAAS